MSERTAFEPADEGQDLGLYLRPTYYIDSDHADVVAFAEESAAGEREPVARARKLYYAVRDGFRYDPYSVELTPEGFRASRCLERGYGFCVTKATLLAAAGRALGLPARLGFADVRNHLSTKRLTEMLDGTDLFVYHGFTEFHLEGKWVKATPAFNLSLCRKFRVLPLEFDGRNDSIFHPFDADGRRHMEYVAERGSFADVPFEAIRDSFLEHYPRVYADYIDGDAGGDFEAEAEAETAIEVGD